MALTDKAKRVDFILSCSGAGASELASLSEDISIALQHMEAVAYAYILHDLDVKEDGTLKTPHFHIVGEFPSAKRLSTFLNALASELSVNPMAISVQKCASFEGSLQYLIHKNDADKHQYSPSSIVSNLNADMLDLYMNVESDTLTFDRLLQLCRDLKNPILVGRRIGLGRYQIYRKVIEDCFMFIHAEERAKKLQEALSKN